MIASRLELRPLHANFGVEVTGLDLRDLTPEVGYPTIRDLFEEHSLLVFRDQHLDDAEHLRVGGLFGPVEDRSMGADGDTPRMSHVSNVRTDGTLAPADDLLTLDLMGNQLWHTDSIFLPVPALANVLAARVLTSIGGETEFVSTRTGFASLPDEVRRRLAHTTFTHRLAHSRRALSDTLVERHRARFADQHWPAIWRNPVHGADALHIASHTCAVDGDEGAAAQAFIDGLIEHCTRPELVYTHRWQLGDVLVWDERATMHRGRPWPYDEARTLASICITTTDADRSP